MSGFISLPLISAVIPLAVIPILIRTLGAGGWASIAIGMSIGAAGAILVNWGWGLVGPAEVARLGQHDASRVYSISFFMRCALALPVSAAVFLISQFLDAANTGVAAGLMAVATALSGLSPAWYFVGIGRPSGVLIWDTAPRFVAALVAIPVLLIAPDGTLYALVNLAICGGAWVFAGLVVGWPGRLPGMRPYWHAGWVSFKEQSSIALSGIISGGYTSLTVALVSAANFSAVAPFAAADRFRAMAKQGEMAVANGLQGWVGSATGRDQRRRMARALTLMSTAGLIAGSAFAFGMPLLGPLLLGPEVHVDPLTCVFMGFALFMTGISLSTSLHVLAPLRRRHSISIATTVGAVVGVPCVTLGAALYGSPGAGAGLAAAETMVVAIQLPLAWRLITRGRDEPLEGTSAAVQAEV